MAPAWAAPVASFTYSPAQPFTGQTITFTSTSMMAPTITWDWDGDGCDDASGSTATTSFALAASYTVTICASDGVLTATQPQIITVHNRPPTAAFTVVPSQPVAGEGVVLTSTAFDPDGPIVTQEWDLDGDGAFDDHSGEAALYSWPKAGTYSVGLRVTDRNGASAIGRVSVVVAKKPLKRFKRTPLVRVVSHSTSTGVHLDLLTVSASKGVKIGVRCRGGGCPYKRASTTSKGKIVSLRKLNRSFRAGAVIDIRVTKAGYLGKFTRIKIHAGQRPSRVDRCLNSDQSKPIHCP